MATAMERHGGEERIQPALATPPLLVGIKEVARMLSVSVRTIERFMATERFPAPDVRIGARILWKPATITSWVEKESSKGHADPGHPMPPPPKAAPVAAAKQAVKRRAPGTPPTAPVGTGTAASAMAMTSKPKAKR